MALALALALPIVACASTEPAVAQKPQADWQFSLGLFGMYLPRYQGSPHYRVLVVPNIEIKYKKRFFLSAYQGLGVNLLQTKHWSAGTSLTIDYINGRKRSQQFAGLNDIKNWFSANAFVRYQQFPFNLSANLSHGLGAWDLGSRLRLAATGELPLSKKVFIMMGPSLVFSDSNYMRTYYAIDASQSANTGLPQFKSHAGLSEVAFGGSIFYKFAPQWTAGAYENITRYVGSVQKSPLILRKVDFYTAFGITYHFKA